MKSLKELFLHQLGSRLSSEMQLVLGMPYVIEEATASTLQSLMLSHHHETVRQIEKLTHVFQAFNQPAIATKCEVTAKLIQECHHMIHAFGNSPAINAALAGAAQKIEHLEIASYGSLYEWSLLLRNDEATGLLQELLSEERTADQLLIKLARFRCNKQAIVENNGTELQCDAYGHLARSSPPQMTMPGILS
ncbi:DUF892 family protein [Verrucomicrobium spinosum]|uniref:DUF892 family protein n=1 Tax=Verrucomicrobium spinosum TaxID=2736 RepID=UPI0001745B39|nr:DUF892 family protein [Verrucomicrobium spinosum]